MVNKFWFEAKKINCFKNGYRVIKNLEAISVIIYQELTTDIRGEPL